MLKHIDISVVIYVSTHTMRANTDCKSHVSPAQASLLVMRSGQVLNFENTSSFPSCAGFTTAGKGCAPVLCPFSAGEGTLMVTE